MKRAIIRYTNCFSLTRSLLKTERESVSWGAIDCCSLRALPEYVNDSDESYVNITPATAINAAWDSQWDQRSCTRAENRREKKACDFWLIPEKSERSYYKKYTLINT